MRTAWILLIAIALCCSTAAGEDELKLSEVIEQAKLARHGKLDQPKLQAMLRRLVKLWEEESGREHSVPISYKIVRPVKAGENDIENSLRAMNSAQIARVNRCIVLAETAVEIAFAEDSIIIAGTRVDVAFGTNCVIIAGVDVNCSSGLDSLLLSGGELRASSTHASVLGAIEITASIGDYKIQLKGDELAKHKLDLKVDPPKNELAELITLTRVESDPLIVFRRKLDGGEYVIRGNKELKSPTGEVLPELAGWKLRYASSGNKIAVLEKDDRHLVLKMPK